MKKLTVLVTMAILMGIISCSGPGNKEFDYGRIENGIYHNNFFGFSINIPDEWYVLNDEQRMAIMEIGYSLMDESVQQSIDVNDISNATLLGLYRYEPGTLLEEYNCNLLVVAENLGMLPGVKKPEQYLKMSENTLRLSNLDYKKLSEYYTVDVAGRQFHAMLLQVDLGVVIAEQLYLTTFVNGFAFNIIGSYHGAEQRELLDEIIETARFI